MLIFICDQWYKLREVPGDYLLCFVSVIPEKKLGYFMLWESETEQNERMATKTLPFCGHQNGVYEGCVMASFHPDGPPHAHIIRYQKKVVQTL